MINSQSSIGDLASGVDFLGYHIDNSGKSIPAKAEESLSNRLEMMWLTSGHLDFAEKIKKALEIIGGWKQYFREDRKIGSIIEYTALIYAVKNDEEMFEKLIGLRSDFNNPYKDIAMFLSELCFEKKYKELELLEYEQYYQLPYSFKTGEKIQKQHEELLAAYRQNFHIETEESILEIMQCYTDLKAYEHAGYWLEKKESLSKSKKLAQINIRERPLIEDNSTSETLLMGRDTARKLRNLFAGREDIYAEETFDNSRHSELKTFPLTDKEVETHLKGGMTVGTYIQRPNGTVKYVVFDVDISKRILIQYEKNPTVLGAYYEKALKRSLEICDILKKFGLKGYIEDSGNRGYHVWMFFTEWIPVRYVNIFCDILQAKFPDQKDEEITVEYFPNKTRIKQGKYGQVIKLPYGIHIKSGRRSFFLDEDMNRIDALDVFIDNVAKFSLNAIKKVLAGNSGVTEIDSKKIVDEDLTSFGKLPAGVIEVLSKCSLMRYLCQKAAKTGYLTHFERLSILYVFGHVGDEGKEFIHKVMSMTLNYQYNVTEKFVRKLPAKPVSCIKLREQYKQITAEYGCNCVFKNAKNCYPSPVLHAISLSNDLTEDITLPTSRSMSKENEKKAMDEINIHSKAQELAVKILEYKKQKRGLDKSISKLEAGLMQIFDNAGIDSLEIEMGMLVRRKKDNGYEWLIEI